ncbi:MAG: OmpA family protein, partial [Desulfobacterales bacterium]
TEYLVRIEGHTDNVPIRTFLFPSNWELSTARAVNVLRYFIEHHQIDSQRLSAEGFGEFQPLVANDTAENRNKNRRVEVIFIRPENPDPDSGERS